MKKLVAFFISIAGLALLFAGEVRYETPSASGASGNGTTGDLTLNTSSMSLVNTSTSSGNLFNTSGSTQTKSGSAVFGGSVKATSGAFTNITFGDGTTQITAPGAGGGNNQQVNTSTDDIVIAEGGGSVFLATSPIIGAIPGKYFMTSASTLNCLGIQAFIAKPSTALDGNITFILKVSSSGDGIPSFTISSATLPSSATTYQSVFQDTVAVISAYNFIGVQISSVPSGPALPGEDWKIKMRRWLSP